MDRNADDMKGLIDAFDRIEETRNLGDPLRTDAAIHEFERAFDAAVERALRRIFNSGTNSLTAKAFRKMMDRSRFPQS